MSQIWEPLICLQVTVRMALHVLEMNWHWIFWLSLIIEKPKVVVDGGRA